MKSLTLLRVGLSVLGCLTSAAYAIELSPMEAAGKRLYHEGVSASGAQVSAHIGVSGTAVPAATVPCAGCHGADGRGRPEGGVRPPDITWRRLGTPYGQQVRTGRSHPPYTDTALIHAITEGIDPAGNVLDSAMPRFVMSSQDQLNLVAYLKRIEDDGDPGVQATTLRLGTLLPSRGAMAPLGETVGAVLKGALAVINETGGIHGRRLELQIVDPGPDAESAKAALQTLSGDNGVFALIAPLAPAPDERLAEWLEQARLPVVGSVSLLGGDSDSPLIFEPLPGTAEQWRALASYAQQDLTLAQQKALIVYPDTEQDRQQADALKQHLNAQGWTDVSAQGYPAGQPGSAGASAAQARSVFFLGRSVDFGPLTQTLEEAGQRPYLFAASAQVPADIWQVPPSFSRRLLLAYPFIPADWTPEGKAALAAVRERSGLNGQYAVLQVDAYCSVLLLAEALRQIGRNPARAQLIKALEGLHDVQTGLTPLLGFGPGRRVGMSGAHVVTVDLQRKTFELVSPYTRVTAAN